MNIDAETLRRWLEEDKPVFILDVRPKEQRQEWQIPGSHYLDAYQKLNAGDTSILDEVSIPENIPVVTVCAAGRTSLIAAKELEKKGMEVYSLEGGMKAWSLAWNTARINKDELNIIQFRRTGKGCLSYMLSSQNDAIVIDASLGTDVYTQFASKNGWKIKYVLDTHIHADHLSRSLQLSMTTGAELYMPEQDKLKFKFKKIKDGDAFKIGTSTLKALSTPGHTLESISYLLDDQFLFTGDTLFIDGVGRPDLKAGEEEIRKRASLLYHSLSKLINLSPETVVLPGHTGNPVDFNQNIIAATLENIKAAVSTLKLSEKEFVDIILSKIPPTPPNYLKIVELNLAGDLKDIDAKEIEAGANRCAIS